MEIYFQDGPPDDGGDEVLLMYEGLSHLCPFVCWFVISTLGRFGYNFFAALYVSSLVRLSVFYYSSLELITNLTAVWGLAVAVIVWD